VDIIKTIKAKADELGLQEKAEHLLDEAGKAAAQARDKAGQLAHDNRERIDSALEKVTEKVDDVTGHKLAGPLEKIKETAAKGVDFVEKHGPAGGPTVAGEVADDAAEGGPKA